MDRIDTPSSSSSSSSFLREYAKNKSKEKIQVFIVTI